MLRISTYAEGESLIMKLEGEIAGDWAAELDRCWCSLISSSEPRAAKPVEVDLTAVTYIDAGGEAILTAMYRRGAKLKARGLLNRFIVQQITHPGRKGGPEPSGGR